MKPFESLGLIALAFCVFVVFVGMSWALFGRKAPLVSPRLNPVVDVPGVGRLLLFFGLAAGGWLFEVFKW